MNKPTTKNLNIIKQAKIKHPNAFFYSLAYILAYPILKICFRLKVIRNDLDFPDGPCIILSNHSTIYDFFIVMLSLYPKLVNTVAASKFFLYSPLHWFLPLLGCIPKNMFDPDARSIMGIKAVLNRGGRVLLFPEGRCSSRHAYSGMHKSTGKLIKKLGVPVVSSYIEGAVNCMAIWRRGGMRFGHTRVTHKNLFAVEDLKEMSVDEINAAIDARLSGTEGAAPLAKPLKMFYSRHLADGLHRLLYYCPSCKREFTMTSEKKYLRCTVCGFTATYDKYGKLDGEEISQWFSRQIRYEMEQIDDGMEPIVERVSVRTPSPKRGGGLTESGTGTITIDPKGWRFSGELDGESAELFFPVDVIPAISYDFDRNFQIFHDGNYYMFIPENPHRCIKYMIIAECLHRRFAKEPLLTPGVGVESLIKEPER